MKIKLVAEDEKRGKIEIPLSIKQIRDIYDLGYDVNDETLKLNKWKKTLGRFS